MTFFTRLERQILSGKKTATIRDKSESHYYPGQVVEAFTLEDERKICRLEIVDVENVEFEKLCRKHAKAENLPFVFMLKWLLRNIYPTESSLYFVSFKVVG
ncbi:N(4)-acetylcytidine aminohydrolase [Vibrio splendidus]|uniref:N(4)-acetylcytidine aminohydrolase n=1 Tax=Vibrio splendidus TaxID=29497 RepID=UPI000C81FDF9|nr:N(4)-acetylcytidine aminohydrolase [Vibrio splendidus]PMO90458.1 ASCH domain-containing protein [Vibrio splendidus]PMP17717.1 ASCH domain-containing protein [Vibrio splendidus]PMP33997.1 ASCH domain-containing protein [Vibrio splendidus]PMP36483.1 ASCH domain-containing protein [Vibrio splendidus]PMP42701.1 ASCH domain-containing protein [Vibrio splendidus]